ncbi:MAG: DUF3419 family protein [Planctomycetaceae bacterium]
MRIPDRLSNACFQWVHGRNLVYNTCWEDPRIDREALQLRPEHAVLVITSAGCNALDYVLQQPRVVHCVDVNPRQNALLQLKLAGIAALDHTDFFSLFGHGSALHHRELYQDALRPQLEGFAQRYWDKHIDFFRRGPGRASFYFRGTAGYFARSANQFADRVLGIRDQVERLLSAPSVEQQEEIYLREIKPVLWSRPVKWMVARDTTLSLLGVPRAQRQQVERYHGRGIAGFIEECVETVFTRLPLHDNYFWRVYLTGHYTHDCCPEYLRPDNFARLKGGLADRVRIHTTSVAGFLREHDSPIDRFVLLDHMDWMSAWRNDLLQDEWQQLLDRAAPGARFLWRSGGTETAYVDPVLVQRNGRPIRVGDLLHYDRDLANRLHPLDRVHTYGSFHIAHLHS